MGSVMGQPSYLGSGAVQNRYTQQNQTALYAGRVIGLMGGSVFEKAHKLKTELKAGEIIAPRVWFLNRPRYKEIGLLCSMAVDCYWPPQEVITGDVRLAGVHAFKSEEEAFHQYVGKLGKTVLESFRNYPMCYVLGEVALWGEVIEHEKGYRAQFAKIHSIKKFYIHMMTPIL